MKRKLVNFLMGLNDEIFSTICSQVLALELLPSIHVIFNMITQEENHKDLMLARDHKSENMVSFAAREQTHKRSSCKHCGCRGHEEATCYKVVGYPQNWGSRGRGCGNRGGKSY